MFKNIKNIIVKENFELSTISTIRIGGKAKYFIICKNISALKSTIKTCFKHNLDYKVIGGASNILFDDLGFYGVIIKLEFKKLKRYGRIIALSSDINLCSLINFCCQNNLSGLENFIGIPCTLGGAIHNNLGAFENEISNQIISVKYITIKISGKNKLKIKNNHKKINKNDFCYRKTNFLTKNDIILSSKLKLNYLDKDSIILNLHNYFLKKSSSQPVECLSLGSIFKRGDFPPPALLIDKLGLKGYSIGNAEISKKHAGFIINKSNASSEDVKKLISTIKEKVKTKYGFTLEEEIEYLPFSYSSKN